MMQPPSHNSSQLPYPKEEKARLGQGEPLRPPLTENRMFVLSWYTALARVIASTCLFTLPLSPVRMDWSMRISEDSSSTRRVSAGILAPTATSTTSPGTNCSQRKGGGRESHVSVRPCQHALSQSWELQGVRSLPIHATVHSFIAAPPHTSHRASMRTHAGHLAGFPLQQTKKATEESAPLRLAAPASAHPSAPWPHPPHKPSAPRLLSQRWSL